MSELSQIVVGLCFLLLIFVLFFDEKDYLSYSLLLIVIAGGVSAIEIEKARHIDMYIMAIDWEVIFFLIAMFTIVEILNEAHLFHEIARIIVNRYKHNIRKMFYVICIVSTLSASILEDISVAIIFIPIIILTCREIKINPTPFLLGMTICINLASTLTPFGSAENVMIANYFDLSFSFFVLNFGPFFVIATAITLWLLDKMVLSKELQKRTPSKNLKALDSKDSEELMISSETSMQNVPKISITSIKSIDSVESLESACADLEKEKIRADPKVVTKNLIGLGIFILLLVLIPQIHVAGLVGLLVFVLLNPRPGKSGKMGPSVSHFLKKVDFKLVFFFMCLFVLVGLMEENGTVALLESLIEDFTVHNVFLLSIVILIVTSLMSGFMDNAPVTVIFLPIINILWKTGLFDLLPLMVAFVLGVNLGGNFLPQGSAADMMTLELAQQNKVQDLTYKKLTKVGGLFALLHVILGIGYLAFLIYVYPGF